ncbi:MAG TPA: hypothetical protein GXX34_05045 [Clostridia bacterium]|nr:hypothetical protein [Clostridia bacterium]
MGTPAYQDITILNANTTRKLLSLALREEQGYRSSLFPGAVSSPIGAAGIMDFMIRVNGAKRHLKSF